MATKILKSIEISLLGCGDAATVTTADTVTDPQATYALDAFKRSERMDITASDAEYLVPFHAVDHIVVSESTADVEAKNPYGCCPDGTVNGSVVGC